MGTASQGRDGIAAVVFRERAKSVRAERQAT